MAIFVLATTSAPAAVSITAFGTAKFPDRSFLLSIGEKRQLTSGKVRLAENGEEVSVTSAVPLAQSGSGFGTVLVIDTSKSLRAAGIASAMNAAREFAARRDERQPLGVVFFNGAVSTGLPMTTDARQITAALATDPVLAPGTHIYDGVQAATRMLRRARLPAGAVIVLSDGNDTGSRASEAAAVAGARDARARVYSIGLRTPSYTPEALRSLARAADGDYTTATSKAGLTALYGSLGTELSNQYIIRYRSTQPLGKTVGVAVDVAGVGSGKTSYFTPSLPAPEPVSLLDQDSFWATSTATVILAGSGGLLAAIIVLMLLRARKTVRSRVGEFVTIPSPDDDKAWAGALVERALSLSEGRGRRRRRLNPGIVTAEELDLSQISMPLAQLLLWTLVATIVAGWALVIMTGSAAAALLALGVPSVVRGAILVQIQRQRRLFGDQLPDNLQVVASAMRAGHTFLGALGVVVNDTPEPSRREFRRVLSDSQLGVPLSEGLNRVAKRMASRDFEHVALVATLQSETGGNTAEVVEQVADTIRDRVDLRRLVRSLTAQGRLSGFVVSGLPVFLVIVVSLVSPGYISPLFDRAAGIALLIFAAGMIIAGALVIRRIVDIRI